MLNIQKKRKESRITQEELARRISVKRNTISQWETGARRPPSDKLPLIAAALECTINDLYQ